MKKYQKIILFGLFAGSIFLNAKPADAQLVLDCESGNRAIEQANCWGFGATSYSNTPAFIITGNWSTRSNSLTSQLLTACWIKTPWMKIGSGSITFKTRLDGAGNGVTHKGIKISYIAYDPLQPNGEGTSVLFYTYDFPLPFTSTTIRDITAEIPAEIANSTTNVYKIWVSYVGTGGNQRAYSDDFVFPGTYWSDPTNGCLPLSFEPDADGDGVPDDEDDYPDDIYRAFNHFNPATGFGTVAFEDLWPSYGDFDFNDLVIDYRLNYVTNANDELVEMKNQFLIRAIGASQRNGFGFQLKNVPANAVIKTDGDILNMGIINKEANDVESGQSLATFIVIDNASFVLPSPGQGSTGVNTTPGFPWVQPANIDFTVTFIDQGIPAPGGPLVYQTISADPKLFNPFIFINQTRGRELHLANYEPTQLVDPSFFGTYNDHTQPTNNKYFISERNLPWAIIINESFAYPIEKADILTAHLKFVEWAESSGQIYQDWYKDLPGYRDVNKIYQ